MAGSSDEDDILSRTTPAGIPGALFQAMMRRTMDDYKPGTTIVTAAGCGHRAEAHVLAMLEIMMAFYQEVADAEAASGDPIE